MKICIVSPFPPPYGGMAIQAEKLADCLVKEGIDVIRVKTNQDIPDRYRLLTRIPILRTMINLLLFLADLRQVMKQVDIIYFLTGFYNFFFWVTYPALILIKLSGKKVIVSARGGHAREFFIRYRFWVKPILARVDAITTPSGFLKNAVEEVLGLPAVIVRNIADLDQFIFRFRETFAPRVLYTRNLEEIYDPCCAITAFYQVWSRYPDAVLTIAGDGSLRSTAETMASDLGIASAVNFVGQVKHDEIQRLYAEHDIFLNTSRVDNLPGSILEAFACGLPVVSTDAGGIPFMVEDGQTGILCARGDAAALADGIFRILEHPDVGRGLASAGREQAGLYSWREIKASVAELFDRILHPTA